MATPAMSWAQLIKVRLKPGKDPAAAPLRAAQHPGWGLVREMLMHAQEDPATACILAVFESEEKARAREQDRAARKEQRPPGRTTAWWPSLGPAADLGFRGRGAGLGDGSGERSGTRRVTAGHRLGTQSIQDCQRVRIYASEQCPWQDSSGEPLADCEALRCAAIYQEDLLLTITAVCASLVG